MTEYLPSTYGDQIADQYDAMHPAIDQAAIDLLHDLAAGGPVLELGIGTGRIALPLAARGLKMQGVDASEAMVARLRAKPGGKDIPVTIADFREFDLAEKFALIFLAFNTIFALQSQEDQIQCFRTVARHLRPGGCFLIEAFVPDLTRFDLGQRASVRSIDTDSAMLELSRHDAVAQRVDSQLIRLSSGGLELYPVRLRYAWPSELDLMARLADLTPAHRWANWQREAFGATSGFHVSVYRLEE
ncbi:MAG TPA: class I SAM-dependent methyltransferase [Gemmatimonadaceae bacterium]|nr:class I SAM-dependent methyltransferase [Gemmatimonadaceae bacterium]